MAFATSGFQGYNQPSTTPYSYHNYQAPDTRSQSMPSGLNFPNGASNGPQESSTYNGSNTEHQSTFNDEAGFYERFDKEIYKYVEEVKRNIESVKKERDI